MKHVKKQGFVDRFLSKVETAGNRLPDPIVLFIILMGLILVGSFVSSLFNFKATNPATGEVVEAVNLLSGEGLVQILTESINNFSADRKSTRLNSSHVAISYAVF